MLFQLTDQDLWFLIRGEKLADDLFASQLQRAILRPTTASQDAGRALLSGGLCDQ